ncbi:hypothetical protein APHAL10511_001735 [Amanita phalloides]|nr:hypothetical protein APHAL10511_001735 [Amanita phalloides]
MKASLQEEMTAIGKALAEAQNQLAELVRRVQADDDETLKQLEDDNERLKNNINRLKNVNAALQQKAKAHKPELDRAIEARDGAFRKLKHARRVIKDLIEEREKIENSQRSRTVSPALSAITIGSMKDRSSSTSSTTSANSSADSSRTIRSRPDRGRAVDVRRLTSPRSISSMEADLFPGQIVSTSEGSRSRTQSLARSQTTSVAPSSPRSSSSRTTNESSWLIYFSKPPKSANLHRGPFSWGDLRHIFSLEDQTVSALRSLESEGRLQMRVLIMQDVAFVYDPIFADLGQKSYLLDWGRKDDNERIVNFITLKGAVYHTFVFPTSRIKWYYVGALSWKAVESRAIWPSLRQKAQAEIVRRLKARSCAEEQLQERLATGDAEQISIEINGEGQDQASHAQATGDAEKSIEIDSIKCRNSKDYLRSYRFLMSSLLPSFAVLSFILHLVKCHSSTVFTSSTASSSSLSFSANNTFSHASTLSLPSSSTFATASSFSHASSPASSQRLSTQTDFPTSSSSSSPSSTPTSSASYAFSSSSSSSSSTPSAAPMTTLVVQTSTTVSVVDVATPTVSITITPNSASVNSASAGFWSEKGNVTATFTVVGLLACGVIGGAVYIMVRRRRRDKAVVERLRASPDVTHFFSPPPSLSQVCANHAQTEAGHGLDYSPYDPNINAGHVEVALQDESNTSPAPRHAPINAPPVSSRLPQGRNYQPSIDSFYGGIEGK